MSLSKPTTEAISQVLTGASYGHFNPSFPSCCFKIRKDMIKVGWGGGVETLETQSGRVSKISEPGESEESPCSHIWTGVYVKRMTDRFPVRSNAYSVTVSPRSYFIVFVCICLHQAPSMA